MKKPFIAGLALAGLLALAAPSAAENPLDPFFGAYEGRSIDAPDETLSARDLSVTIRPKGKGFRLDWTTVIHHAQGPKRQSYAIDFAPTDRPDTFASSMHRDVFGETEPLDPLKGQPYVWAHLAGKTLTVYALMIPDDGGYEVQTYERTLTAEGMDLRFARDLNGKETKIITGSLKRTGP
ncbi:MAG: hypothetical protein JO010_00730 [Alphaproteobacteria bacterium]|nr:hypothetical protein [Alphaproteobacteria bacterium]